MAQCLYLKKTLPSRFRDHQKTWRVKKKDFSELLNQEKKGLKISSSEEYTAIVIRKYSISKLKIDSSVFVQK